MSWKKTHDLAVVTGTYQKDGADKKRYLNVGEIIKNDADGGELMQMFSWFSPAAIPPFREGGDKITLYKFEVRDKAALEPAPAKAQQAGKPASSKGHPSDLDDDIPF